jgi:hypothetical protein
MLRLIGLGLLVGGTSPLLACTPRIVVETPNEPIVINMNIKVEHEVRIKIDKELDSLIEEDDDLF